MTTLEELGECPEGYRVVGNVMVHEPPTPSELLWLRLKEFEQELSKLLALMLYQTSIEIRPTSRLQNGGVKLLLLVNFEPRQNVGQLYDMCFDEDDMGDPAKVIEELRGNEEFISKVNKTMESYVPLHTLKVGELFKLVGMGSMEGDVWKLLGTQRGVWGPLRTMSGEPFAIACTKLGRPQAFSDELKVLKVRPGGLAAEVDEEVGDGEFYTWGHNGKRILGWDEVG